MGTAAVLAILFVVVAVAAALVVATNYVLRRMGDGHDHPSTSRHQ